jgi:heme-degrading monooxygenase HmoA
MIARIWRGVTPESKADPYFNYLLATGVKDYRAIKGNCGAMVLRRSSERRAEFLLISLWESLDAIRQYAGPDAEVAVYYGADKEYLLELEPKVVHYDVLFESRD